MNDFWQARVAREGYRKLRPKDVAKIHFATMTWLDERLSQPFPGPIRAFQMKEKFGGLRFYLATDGLRLGLIDPDGVTSLERSSRRNPGQCRQA